MLALHGFTQHYATTATGKRPQNVPQRPQEGFKARNCAVQPRTAPYNPGLLHTAPIREVPLVAKGGQEEKQINHYLPLVTETVVRKLLLFFFVYPPLWIFLWPGNLKCGLPALIYRKRSTV